MDDKVELLKALADKNRLLILEMLSCGELCACDIMDGLKLTQPTISHHMKILQHCKLVKSRKEGKWVHYSIDQDKLEELQEFIKRLNSFKGECVCQVKKRENCTCD